MHVRTARQEDRRAARLAAAKARLAATRYSEADALADGYESLEEAQGDAAVNGWGGVAVCDVCGKERCDDMAVCLAHVGPPNPGVWERE